MSKNLLLRKLHIEHVDFVDSKRLRRYCSSLGLDYNTAVSYLLVRKYMIRIFRGIFYVRTLEERDSGTNLYSHLELVSRGLKLKGIDKWYFGLHTALKLNNVTHESFNIDDIMSTTLFRPKPMVIAGHKFKFYKVSSKLMGFGIVEKDGLKYSNLEKTILDFAYLWRYSGISDAKITADLSEWSRGASKERIKSYMGNYPKSLRPTIRALMR
jgi:hypothetical protein